MDLREIIKPQQLLQGIELIKSGHIFYQPFILNENLEVGEGQNLIDKYKDSKHIHDLNVYADGFDFGERKLAKDKNYFRMCNAEYRGIYDFITETIISYTKKDITTLSVAEIGCNTGLTLFNFAKRGVLSCNGYDWSDMQPVFDWLNNILKTKVKFKQGVWDNLYHRFTTEDIPVYDIMINTVYMNHQFDPLQFLSYICDRARVGVFLWILMASGNDSCVVEYPPIPPHDILDTENRFPLNFNNAVAVSKKLLIASLNKLGFGKVQEISMPLPSNKWRDFLGGFRMFYAERTSDVKSAFWRNENS